MARDRFLMGELQPALRLLGPSTLGNPQQAIFGGAEAQLLILASGLGEATSGAVASALVVEVIARHLLECRSVRQSNRQAVLAAALASSQEGVRQRRALRGAAIPGGASVTVALVEWPDVWIAHAGDTRCFLYNRLRLRQLTSVHTLGARCGELGETDSWLASSWREILWNAITGAGRDAEPEFLQEKLSLGDALVLMTAPVAKAVSESRIATLLREDFSASETCRRLVELAQAAGYHDEGTVMVVRYRSPQRWEQLQSMHRSSPLTGGGNGSRITAPHDDSNPMRDLPSVTMPLRNGGSGVWPQPND